MNNISKPSPPTLDEVIDLADKFLKAMKPGMDKARMQRIVKQLEVIKENEGK
jgi:hypothetical protein